MKITMSKKALLDKLKEGQENAVKQAELFNERNHKAYEKDLISVRKTLEKYLSQLDRTGEVKPENRYGNSIWLEKPNVTLPDTSEFTGAINLINSITDEEITFDLNRDKLGIVTTLRKALGIR